jgi:predicted permease
MAVKIDLGGRSSMFSNMLDAVLFFIKEIIFHPLLIVCFMGVFLLGANIWLLSLWENMIDFIYPAVLPFCLVVTGAMFGTSKLIKKLIVFFRKKRAPLC